MNLVQLEQNPFLFMVDIIKKLENYLKDKHHVKNVMGLVAITVISKGWKL